MEANRDLYKVKSRRGLASREKRAHLKDQESKSGRDALLLSKRRIPLSPLQEKQEGMGEISKGSKMTRAEKSQERLQKLMEWKKKRDEAREKEKANKAKKRPFVGGASHSISAFTATVTTSTSFAHGAAVLKGKEKNVCDPSVNFSKTTGNVPTSKKEHVSTTILSTCRSEPNRMAGGGISKWSTPSAQQTVKKDVVESKPSSRSIKKVTMATRTSKRVADRSTANQRETKELLKVKNTAALPHFVKSKPPITLRNKPTANTTTTRTARVVTKGDRKGPQNSQPLFPTTRSTGKKKTPEKVRGPTTFSGKKKTPEKTRGQTWSGKKKDPRKSTGADDIEWEKENPRCV